MSIISITIMTKAKDDNFFAGMDPLPTKHWSMKKMGDRIKGTFITKMEVADHVYSGGAMKTYYVIKAEAGHGHDKDGKKVELVPGEYYLCKHRVGMGKYFPRDGRDLVVPGQELGFEYTYDQDTQKGNKAMCVTVHLGAIQADFVAPSFALAEGDGISADDLPAVLGGPEDGPEVPPFA